MYKYLFCFLILFSCSMSSMLGQANRRNIGQSRRTDSTQSSNNGQNRRSSTSQSSALDRIFGSSRNTGSSQSSSVGRNNAEQQESPESVAIKLIKHDISLNKYLANPTIYVFRGLPQVPPRGLSEVYDKMLQRLTDEAKELVSSLMAQDITYKEYHKMSKSKREKANLPGEEPILARKIWDNRENYQLQASNGVAAGINETNNNMSLDVVENNTISSVNINETDNSRLDGTKNQISASSNQSNIGSSGQSITLVVSGEGNTKEDATKNALRSAIEQAFGTFVSANTNVINDELVRDEIVTVSSGNIQAFKEISSMEVDGMKSVTLQATVSIGKLVSYAQNKGMQAELAGASFAMNKKIRQLNKTNEEKAMEHLMEQLDHIAAQGLYDYEIETSDPRNSYHVSGYNSLEVIITATINDNGKNYLKTLKQTLASLELTSLEEYRNANEKYYDLRIYSKSTPNAQGDLEGVYVLRNPISYSMGDAYPIAHFINRSLLNFIVKDNLGNDYQIVYKKDNYYDPNSSQGRIPSDGFVKEMDYWDTYNYEHGNSYTTDLYKNTCSFYLGYTPNTYIAYYPFSMFDAYSSFNPEFWQTHHFAPYRTPNRDDKIRLSFFTSDKFYYYTKVRFRLVANYTDEQLMNLTGIFVEPIK